MPESIGISGFREKEKGQKRSPFAAINAAIAALELKPTELLVDSVTAKNLKQIEIKFNKAVDSTTAGDVANYEVYDNGSTTKVAGVYLTELSSDSKTVLLTLVNDATTKLTNLSTAKVVVKKAVKDADGVALAADYTNDAVAVSDVTRPTIAGVTQTGPNKIKVAFSEPVIDASTGNLTVDAGDMGTFQLSHKIKMSVLLCTLLVEKV
ncbi:MAG: hypothetical protein BI182_05995 [Acetobacterium sp. MES1]|uniref:Ig-like domain-containing protein n=1 Tax=Acetobacterium sp. MES1 TaxID=1899015 RepID=UPI000B9CB212|nr:Ig-like domain-containing protein [Acetobacterium sp. MES1]OXS25281.1 MAG: hypothetical protein BI182_05995 [Acetobacterium sp. MES1]